MPKIEITNRWTDAVIYAGEAATIAELLVNAVRDYINLRDAVLRGADLRGAGKIPVIPNIHQVVYAAASDTDALDMATWHTCETTHCRAGWVVTLAGAAGAAMEWCLGTPAAAALIYQASDPGLEKIPDFYASNEDALADMKKLAESR